MNPVTIIAPGTLHLPLYAQLHEKLGDTTNIRLLGLNSWLREQVEFPAVGNLTQLYQYRDQLQSLSEGNAFYESREDYDFLRDCLKFMQKFFLYGMHLQDLPSKSKRDRDLKEIVTLLSEIPLIESAFAQADFESQDLGDVWILDKNYSLEEQKILERMKKGGAHVLNSMDELQDLSLVPVPAQSDQTAAEAALAQKARQRYYWSASNPRTQMEVIADTIISENMNAEDIYIVLSRPEDASVLQQVFSARKIPLTLLNEPHISPVLSQWKAALNYVYDKSRENLVTLLKVINPLNTAQLRTYMEMFPEGSELADLEYTPNPLISEHDFESMRSMELQAGPWHDLLAKMKTWKADEASMADIAELIQSSNPTPSEDDLRVFDGVCRTYGDVKNRIRSESDLPLLIRHLDSLYPNTALQECTGVLAGNRSEISPLRKTVFYTGADAAHFPSFSMNSGIFDENYMQKLAPVYPDLSARLETQRKSLFHSLEIPEELYVLVPQADYEGKSSDTSYEMFTWMNAHPKFQTWKDSSWYVKPDFSLSEDVSSELFFKDRTFTASLSSLNSYESCPLQHLLRYGMKLKKPYVFEDQLEVRADILKDVIESSTLWFSKPVWDLSDEEIRFLVSRQFEFARKVFKDRKEALQILELEYVKKIKEMIEILAPITQSLNASIVADQVEIQVTGDKDGVSMEIEGALNRRTRNRTPLALMSSDIPEPQIISDESNDEQTQDRREFHEAMAALDISLKQKPVSNRAFAISMGRGKKPVSANPVSDDQISQEFITQFLKDSVKGQNMPESDSFAGEVIRKKTPSYDKAMEKAKTAADDFVNSLKHGCVLPLHKANACKFCPYKSICRNGSQERTQETTAAALAEYARRNERRNSMKNQKNRVDSEDVSGQIRIPEDEEAEISVQEYSILKDEEENGKGNK